MTLWTSLGHKLEFASSPVTARVRTLGPFVEVPLNKPPPKTQDRQSQFSLDEGFLSLGLDGAAASIARYSKENIQLFGISKTAFNPEEVLKSRKSAEAIGLTVEQERAITGLVPALLSYLSVIQHTQGLEELLFKIVDRPSLWSVLRQGGIQADLAVHPERIRPCLAEGWGLPAGEQTYDFPMTLALNRHPALDITLVVTAPKRPLLVCGGIVGLLAQKAGDPGTSLSFRIVSALCSANAP